MDFILFFAGLIFLVPFAIQLRLYFFTRSYSYLRFSILFMMTFIDSMISSFGLSSFPFQILLSFAFCMTFIIIITIAMEVLDQNFPITRLQWWMIGSIVFILTIAFKYLIQSAEVPNHYTSLRIILGEFFEMTAGIMVIYAFSKLELIQNNPRNVHIRSIWKVTGALLITSATLTISIELIRFYQYQRIQMINPALAPLLNFGDLLVTINVLFISIITLVFAFYYPETLLLSMDQIYKASKLYHLFENNGPMAKPFLYTDDIVLDYLKSLPKDIVDKYRNQENS